MLETYVWLLDGEINANSVCLNWKRIKDIVLLKSYQVGLDYILSLCQMRSVHS